MKIVLHSALIGAVVGAVVATFGITMMSSPIEAPHLTEVLESDKSPAVGERLTVPRNNTCVMCSGRYHFELVAATFEGQDYAPRCEIHTGDQIEVRSVQPDFVVAEVVFHVETPYSSDNRRCSIAEKILFLRDVNVMGGSLDTWRAFLRDMDRDAERELLVDAVRKYQG